MGVWVAEQYKHTLGTAPLRDAHPQYGLTQCSMRIGVGVSTPLWSAQYVMRPLSGTGQYKERPEHCPYSQYVIRPERRPPLSCSPAHVALSFRFQRICKDLQGSARIAQDLQGFQGIVRISADLPGFAWI
jgi:hypothetical protein